MRLPTLIGFRVYAVILILLFFSGCANRLPKLSSEEMLRAYDMEEYESGFIPERNFVELQSFQDLVCSGQGIWSGGDRRRNAIYKIKQRSVAIGADAVIGIDCVPIRQFGSCNMAPFCVGTAVKWVD